MSDIRMSVEMLRHVDRLAQYAKKIDNATQFKIVDRVFKKQAGIVEEEGSLENVCNTLFFEIARAAQESREMW